jgi:hypothetical protein
MEVTTERFIRKPLYVDAVRVTSQNFEAVAAWCDGEIQKETEGPRTGKSYIRVRVQYPKSPRQSKAFSGDWVLYTETGYKVYTNPAFQKSFDPSPVEETKAQAERPATADEIRAALPDAQDRRPTTPPQDERKTLPVQAVEPGADLGTTPQGEEITVVAATPQAIADVVREQQPPSEGIVPVEPPKPGDEQDKWDTPPVPEAVSEQAPEDAAAGKRVLSEEEQRQMGPDAVREMVRSGDVILAQDLAA